MAIGSDSGRLCERLGLIAAVLAMTAGATVAPLHAQTQLADPKDAPKIFATTCSACHKSPAGLAKSGQVAGFLRQHYTTGPEMSAAMAAYLVSAGSGPAGKKGQAEAKAKAKEQPDVPSAAKGKQKREASAQPGERAGDTKSARELAKEAKEARENAKELAKEKRLLRKQLHQAKAHEEPAAPHPAPTAAEPPSRPAPAANAALAEAPAVSAVAAAPAPAAPAAPVAPPVMTLNIPLPEMPTGPPSDLTQSVFSSSPVP